MNKIFRMVGGVTTIAALIVMLFGVYKSMYLDAWVSADYLLCAITGLVFAQITYYETYK